MENTKSSVETQRFVKPQGAVLTYSIETLNGLAQSPLVKAPADLQSIDTKPSKFRPKQNEQFGRKKSVNNRSELESDHGSRHGPSKYNRDGDNTVEWETPSNAQTKNGLGVGGFFGSALEEDDSTPSWYNAPLEEAGRNTSSTTHTVREFEEWKAKMRTEELRKQGYEVSDPEPLASTYDESSDFFSSTSVDHNSAMEEPKAGPVTTGVDRFFSMWGEDSKPSTDATSKAGGVPDMDHGSKFSRFFGGGHPPPPPPPGLASSAPASNLSGSQMPGPASNLVGDVTTEKDADKEGFQRIMLMLGNDKAAAPPVQPAPQPEVKTSGDDMFFQSLLSKGSSSSTPGAQNSTTSNQQGLDHASSNSENNSINFNNSQNAQNGPPGLGPSNGFAPPPLPPGLVLDKNGNPIPPEFMSFPPPPMMHNQQFPPPGTFFSGPPPGQFGSNSGASTYASVAGQSTHGQPQQNTRKRS